MTIWTPELRSEGRPLYVALADEIADAVARGRLSAGQRLPPQRELANTLGIALTTVTRGYAEAERRGLVSGEVGRGTYVRPDGVSALHEGGPGETGFVDLRMNSLGAWPFATELSERLAELIARPGASGLHVYHPHPGTREQRAAGADWLRPRGIDATPERVVVTSGAQHAMTVVLGTLTQAGDTLLTEELTYPGMKLLASFLRIRLRGVAMDAEGIRPDALAEACRETGATVLYCMATLQNPTSATMSAARRREIVAVTEAHGVTIVDDDSYGFLMPDTPSLAGEAADAYYLTGTSKSLVAGLRVGFVVAPPPAVERLAAAVCATTWMTSPPMIAAVSAWIRDGTAERVMAWKRREVAGRQALAREILANHDYRANAVSLHGLLHLPEPWRSPDFATQAERDGVGVTPADDFAAGRLTASHAVRLSVGPAVRAASLERGLRTLDRLVRQPPGPRTAVV